MIRRQRAVDSRNDELLQEHENDQQDQEYPVEVLDNQVQSHRSDTLESALDFAHRIAQHHGPPVRAAHRIIRARKFREQPFHLGLIERRVHFDRGVARR